MSDNLKLGLKIGGVVVAFVLVVWLCVGWYKKHCAEKLMTEANESILKLRATAIEADALLAADKFIMTGDEETVPLERIIRNNRDEIDEINKALKPIAKLMAAGEHDAVRERLESEKSPIKWAKRCEAEIRSKVIGYCNTKRHNRDTVVDNEWLLKARLRKPLAPGLNEKPEDIGKVPAALFAMIPTESAELRRGLDTLAPSLNNSLGANLLKHLPELEHIQRFGKGDSVRRRAADLYSDALTRYTRTQAENDGLDTFYRAEKHDGKYSMEDYQKLLAAQAVPVGDIKAGDASLNQLTAYLNELHEQYFVYVSKHSHESRRFRHSRTVHYRDSKGHSRSKSETYYTNGYAYFYTLTTVRPSGSSSKTIEAGELDSSWRDWDYNHDQKVGWVREWKRLHEDNSTIVRGWQRDLNPHIESEP